MRCPICAELHATDMVAHIIARHPYEAPRILVIEAQARAEAFRDASEVDDWPLSVARGRAEALDVEEIAHKAAQIGFTYGALGRDFEYAYKNVNDMLAEARAILAGETE